MKMSLFVATVFLAFIFISPLGPVQADLINPGYRSVPLDARVDFGEFNDNSWLGYTSEAGDSTASIAQRFYGDKQRHADIRAANPQLKTKELKVGTRLEIPPKRKASKSWRFYWRPHGTKSKQSKQTLLVGPFDDLIQAGHDSAGVLFAATHEQKHAMDKWAFDKTESLRAIPGYAKSRSIRLNRAAVKIGSKTQSVNRIVKIDAIEERRIKTRTVEIHNSNKGLQVVDKNGTELIGTPFFLTSSAGLLLLLIGFFYQRQGQVNRPPVERTAATNTQRD